MSSLSVLLFIEHVKGETGEECQSGEGVNSTVPERVGGGHGEFSWDAGERGLILGAFFYGYLATQIPGGMAAERRGGKWLFGLGVAATAALTTLTPAAARRGGKWALVAVRAAEGLGEGVTFPAMQAMVARWTPAGERGRLAAAIFGGAQAGTVVAMPLSGVLAQDLGWEWVFYAFGALGLVWFAFWCLLVFPDPAGHPRISASELEYLRANTAAFAGESLPPPPFGRILSSPPFLALVAAHMGQNWGLYTLLTEAPTYFSNVQHFSLKEVLRHSLELILV